MSLSDSSKGIKRDSSQVDLESVQVNNQTWWTNNTMSYDWKDKIQQEKYTKSWFDEMDARMIYGHRLFAHSEKPYDKIIPFQSLQGKNVLEIGCGMGLHSELLARSGAKLTSIDISETSVFVTRRRFELNRLQGNILLMDARALQFDDSSFDFVWSWGVIHHSAQTGLIVKEIHRVLKPACEARIMVYNLNGMQAYRIILANYLVEFWQNSSLDDSLWRRTDGFMARYYTDDMFRDLLLTFFSFAELKTFGQDSDGIPLPRLLRKLILRVLGDQEVASMANRRGGFLFATATKSV